MNTALSPLLLLIRYVLTTQLDIDKLYDLETELNHSADSSSQPNINLHYYSSIWNVKNALFFRDFCLSNYRFFSDKLTKGVNGEERMFSDDGSSDSFTQLIIDLFPSPDGILSIHSKSKDPIFPNSLFKVENKESGMKFIINVLKSLLEGKEAFNDELRSQLEGETLAAASSIFERLFAEKSVNNEIKFLIIQAFMIDLLGNIDDINLYSDEIKKNTSLFNNNENLNFEEVQKLDRAMNFMYKSMKGIDNSIQQITTPNLTKSESDFLEYRLGFEEMTLRLMIAAFRRKKPSGEYYFDLKHILVEKSALITFFSNIQPDVLVTDNLIEEWRNVIFQSVCLDETDPRRVTQRHKILLNRRKETEDPNHELKALKLNDCPNKFTIQKTFANFKLVLSSFLEANNPNFSADSIEFSNNSLEGIIEYLNRISGKEEIDPSCLDIEIYSDEDFHLYQMDFFISINDCVVDKISVELTGAEGLANYDNHLDVRIRKALLNPKSDEFKSWDNILENFQGEHIKLLKELFNHNLSCHLVRYNYETITSYKPDSSNDSDENIQDWFTTGFEVNLKWFIKYPENDFSMRLYTFIPGDSLEIILIKILSMHKNFLNEKSKTEHDVTKKTIEKNEVVEKVYENYLSSKTRFLPGDFVSAARWLLFSPNLVDETKLFEMTIELMNANSQLLPLWIQNLADKKLDNNVLKITKKFKFKNFITSLQNNPQILSVLGIKSIVIMPENTNQSSELSQNINLWKLLKLLPHLKAVEDFSFIKTDFKASEMNDVLTCLDFNKIKSLNLSESDLFGDFSNESGVEAINEICKTIGEFKNLKKLSLEKTSIDEKTFFSLKNALNKMKELEELNLSDNAFTQQSEPANDTQNLKALKIGLPSLKKLNFSNMKLDKLGIAILENILLDAKNLQELNLSWCEIIDSDSKNEELPANNFTLSSLIKLDLSLISLDLSKMNILKKILSAATNLKDLNLSNCNISAPNKAQELADILKNLTSIVRLNLGGNKMTLNSTNYFFQVISHMKGMGSLYLWGNPFPNKSPLRKASYDALASLLNNLPGLKYLDLSSCSLMKVTKILGNAIIDHLSLISLVLDNNPLRPSDFRILFSKKSDSKSKSKIENLSLRFFTTDGKYQENQNITRATPVEVLSVTARKPGKDYIKRFRLDTKFLKSLPNLKSLDISDNLGILDNSLVRVSSEIYSLPNFNRLIANKTGNFIKYQNFLSLKKNLNRFSEIYIFEDNDQELIKRIQSEADPIKV